MIHSSIPLSRSEAGICVRSGPGSTRRKRRGMTNSSSDKVESTSDRLQRFGFVAGTPVYVIDNEITLEEFHRSLIDSTYTDPIDVLLKGRGSAMRLVVTKAEAVYGVHQTYALEKPLACELPPSWRFEGWILKSGFDPSTELVRARCFAWVDAQSGDIFDIYVQRILDGTFDEAEEVELNEDW